MALRDGVTEVTGLETSGPAQLAGLARAAQKDTPSIWFVNSHKQTASKSTELKALMEDVLNYRCWANDMWWSNVHKKMKSEPMAKQSTYAAKVGASHMLQTPWLAFNRPEDKKIEIRCYKTEFNSKLMEKFFENFVAMTPGSLTALEGISTTIISTIKQSPSNNETKAIVLQKNEPVPESNMIVSRIRVIRLDSMQDLQDPKKSDDQLIAYKINYGQFEGVFNRESWRRNAAPMIDRNKIEAYKNFVEGITINISPDV